MGVKTLSRVTWFNHHTVISVTRQSLILCCGFQIVIVEVQGLKSVAPNRIVYCTMEVEGGEKLQTDQAEASRPQWVLLSSLLTVSWVKKRWHCIIIFSWASLILIRPVLLNLHIKLWLKIRTLSQKYLVDHIKVLFKLCVWAFTLGNETLWPAKPFPLVAR